MAASSAGEEPADRPPPTRGDLGRIARLAGLDLDREEAAGLAEELARLMERFRGVVGSAPAEEEPDAAGDSEAPPDAGTALLREDVVDPDPLRRPPASLAPRWKEGFFLVPPPPGLGDRRDREARGDGSP